MLLDTEYPSVYPTDMAVIERRRAGGPVADWVETRTGALNLDRAQHIAIEAHKDKPGKFVLLVQMGPAKHFIGEFGSSKAARLHLSQLLEWGTE